MTDEVHNSSDTGLHVVRDADRQQAPLARGRALMQAAERRLDQAVQPDVLARSIVNDVVPEWSDAAVLDLVDTRRSVTRGAAAANDVARALGPRLRERAADDITREAVAQVIESGLAYTGAVWVAPRADEPPPEGADHDGATRWHIHVIPLFVRTRMVAMLTAISERGFHTDAANLIREYARRVAPALELSRLEALDHENASLGSAERHLNLLVDVGELISEVPDEGVLLGKVAERIVQDTADYCAIELHEHTGKSRVSVIRFAGGLSALAPDRLKSLVNPSEPASIEAVPSNSWITVPIASRSAIEGTITLVSVRRGIEYGPRELKLVTDVAGRLAAAVERARLCRSSQLAQLAKSEFLSVMSHELRTPLTAILGYAALLREGFAGRLTATQARHLTGIENSGVHMVAMIDDILSFVGMEAGWDVVVPSVVSVPEVVNEVFIPARRIAQRKGLDLHVEFGDLPRAIRMDAAKVSRLLGNLLSNAVKFTESGAVSLRVDYALNTLLFEVRDSGSGVTAAQQGQIFEPFWQAEPATTRRVGGIGLGLSVARRIVTLLGGALEVESGSDNGKGSVFTARIPVEEVEAGRP